MNTPHTWRVYPVRIGSFKCVDRKVGFGLLISASWVSIDRRHENVAPLSHTNCCNIWWLSDMQVRQQMWIFM